MLLFYKHIFDYCVFFTTHIILYQVCISHLLFGQKHPVNLDKVSQCLCLTFKPNLPPYPHVPQYTSHLILQFLSSFVPQTFIEQPPATGDMKMYSLPSRELPIQWERQMGTLKATTPGD